MLIHFCVEKLSENTYIAVSALTFCQQFLNGSFFQTSLETVKTPLKSNFQASFLTFTTKYLLIPSL